MQPSSSNYISSMSLIDLEPKEDSEQKDKKKVITNPYSFIVIKFETFTSFPIYAAMLHSSGQMQALKLFPLDSKQELSPSYLRELKASKFNNPHIISHTFSKNKAKFLVSDHEDQRLSSYILMEYAPYGNLNKLLESGKFPDDEKLVRTIFRQMCEAIRSVHNKGFAHCDLKPSIFLIGDEYKIKLTGFDLMEPLKIQKPISIKGLKNFRAPELKTGPCEDLGAIDVYALGIMLMLLQSKDSPYIEDMMYLEYDLEKMLHNKDSKFWTVHPTMKLPKDYTSEFKELVFGMTSKFSWERLNIKQVMANAWFRGPVYEPDEYKEIMEKLNL